MNRRRRLAVRVATSLIASTHQASGRNEQWSGWGAISEIERHQHRLVNGGALGSVNYAGLVGGATTSEHEANVTSAASGWKGNSRDLNSCSPGIHPLVNRP